jgi:RHS repeat-associated protein
MKLKLTFLLFAAAIFTQAELFGDFEQGGDNPAGVSGIYNGNVTTGGSYDPYTGNAMRSVDDIVVPGSVGAYPLKWTRYFNSHVTRNDSEMGGSWRFSYLDYRWENWNGHKNPCYPDGRRIMINPPPTIYGVEEYWDPVSPFTVRMPDGGKIVYSNTFPYYYNGQWYNVPTVYNYPSQIIDPYGQVTTLSWVFYGLTQDYKVQIKLDKVTEPGGRYLKVNWDATNSLITSVQAFDGVSSQPIQSVTYTQSNFTLGGNTVKVLSRVDYSDGTFATYTYSDQTYPGPYSCNPPNTFLWDSVVLATADDVRYNGPMRQIKYQYYATKNKTRVLSEQHLPTGNTVSAIAGVGNIQTISATETRGDGPTRTFNYHTAPPCPDCPPPTIEGGECVDPMPLDGKLLSYTDFQGHTTTLTYETDSGKASAGFITAVTDANGNTTTYTRSTLSWGILRITHPDGNHIDQTFTDEAHPHYLASRTDELGRTTTYTRDSNNRITRKDYPTPAATALDPSPSAVYETFTYNTFNEVLTHRMANNGTEYFAYDTRGLKTSYTDALGSGPGDPNHTTTYTYYTSGPWTDRIQTVTYPLNASGVRATETYDYDRAYDVNGENSGASTGQAPIAGRGLVTRITHADGKYQALGYDKYGNKLWQEDELRHRTTMVYDDYRRVLTMTDPLNHTVTNNYVPTGKSSSWITTSNLPFYTMLPSTKKTNFYYDGNWHKTRVQQAPGTADEANSYFAYDNVGNLLTAQDPRNNVTTNAYDVRDRLTSTTDALSHATSFTYDAHSNKLTTTKANSEVVTNVYDKLNRVIQVRTTRDASTTDVRNSAYDAAGNLIKFQDENAASRSDTTNIYTYTYDLKNRITSMIYPNALHEDTSYDNAENVVTYKNRASATKTFSQFDNRNRSHRFDWNDGITPWQSTSYDDASRITQIANSVSTINNTYLNDNHLSTQEEWTSAFNDNNHRIVTYAYDVDGNRQTVTYPSGTLFNYNYTQRNQVSSVADSTQHHIVDYTYDASGNVANRALDNGTSTAYTVDQVNRDTVVAHSLVGTTRRFDYAYNSVNDILAAQRDSGLGDGFTYDLTQEILGFAQNGTVNLGTGAVTNPQTNTNLTFDGCGNQTSLNGGGTFAVDNLSEYTTFNGAALTYDNDGDVLTYSGWTYAYDAQNRLMSATGAGGTASFYYDGLNRQIARSINGTITFSVWDGDWAIVEEYGPNNAVTQKYLQGYHGLVKTFVGTAVYYYQDELGSTSHISSATGALLEYYRYDLYGKPTYWSSTSQQLNSSTYGVKDLFTGQRWINELALYDDRNRFMSPTLGRFIQPDPIGFKGDASNLYRYCGNDWANRTDPMGLDPSVNPVDTIQLRNTAQDALGVQKFAQLKQSVQQSVAHADAKKVESKSSPNQTAAPKDVGSPKGFWHDPRIGRDGLVPMSSALKGLIISGLRAGANENGNEVNKAVWIDPSTGKLMPSTGSTGSRPFQGGQQGFPPLPPNNSGLRVAADMHSHNYPPGHMTGNEGPSGHDFRHGNFYLVPVGVQSPAGAIYIYRARVGVNPSSGLMEGKVGGPF